MKIDKNNPDKYWKLLSDIPIDNKERIEEEFLHFPEGTYREDVWYWFEEYFDISLGDKYF